MKIALHSRGSDTKIKYVKQTHSEAMLTYVLFNEDELHPYIGKDSTKLVTCKPKTTRLLTRLQLTLTTEVYN